MIQPWPTLTDRTIVLVAGLGRCGTSLLMQMLEAGGAPVVGTWPDYEPAIIEITPGTSDTWRTVARGRCIKVLDPHRYTPPAGEDYRIIWLDRNPVEQARSQLKMAGAPPTRGNRKGMERLLHRDLRLAQQQLLSIDTAGIVGIKFEDLIERPARVAAEIATKMGKVLDQPAMVAQVYDRSARCFNGMLEQRLIALGRAA